MELPKWLSIATCENHLWNLVVLRTFQEWTEREFVLFHLLAQKVGTWKDPSFWTMNRRVRWSIVQAFLKSGRENPPRWFTSQVQLQKRNGYRLPIHPRRIHGWRKSPEWIKLVEWKFTTRKPPRVRPKRYIGVGYRDQGTYRDKARFGTPSWQEVAMVPDQVPRKPHLTPPLLSAHSPWGPHESRFWPKGELNR